MKNLLFFLFLIFLTGYTLSQSDLEKAKEQIKQSDLDFSDLSKAKGMKEAFLSYIADDGVLLRPYSYPIVGIDSVKKLLDSEPITFTLTWYPLFADVSSSLDLGYTYGLYELTDKDEKGNLISRKGKYCTIWKKQPDGKWKYVLDTGNSGLEPLK
ncbi:MAG TPA: DUF4440 domain-containing protein [Ignavibacteria bacterium]